MKHRVLLLALACGALMPVPAVAQEGSGLYSPSPRKAGERRAEHFVADMLAANAGRRVAAPADSQLDQGSFRGTLRPAEGRTGDATARAIATDPGTTKPAWLLVAAATALAAAASVRLRGRTPEGTGR